MDALDRLLADTINTASDMIRSHGKLSAALIAECPLGRMVVDAGVTDNAGKDRLAELATLLFAAYGVERYAFVGEISFLDELRTQPTDASVAKHPTRQEGVLVFAADHGRSVGRLFPVLRGPGNRAVAVGEPTAVLDGFDAQGPLATLLPPSDIPDVFRAMARDKIRQLTRSGAVATRGVMRGNPLWN